MGDIEIPLIAWRNYLDDDLDTQDSRQSFASRQRLLNHDGDASNQVLWFSDLEQFDPTPMAFEVIDEWMRNIAAGIYGGVVFDAAQRARLDAIFPTGVCDYAQGDARKP